MLRICNRGLAYFLFKTLVNFVISASIIATMIVDFHPQPASYKACPITPFWEGGSHPPKKQLPTRSKLEKLKLESWVAAGMYKDICHGGGKKLKAAAVDITVVLVGL